MQIAELVVQGESQMEMLVDDVEKAAGLLHHRAVHLRYLQIVWTVVFRPGKITYLPCSWAMEF